MILCDSCGVKIDRYFMLKTFDKYRNVPKVSLEKWTYCYVCYGIVLRAIHTVEDDIKKKGKVNENDPSKRD